MLQSVMSYHNRCSVRKTLHAQSLVWSRLHTEKDNNALVFTFWCNDVTHKNSHWQGKKQVEYKKRETL